MGQMGHSTHTFTVVVECDTSEDYERAVAAISSVGEITDEQ